MFPNDCCKFIHSCTGDLCDSEDKRIKVKFDYLGIVLLMG